MPTEELAVIQASLQRALHALRATASTLFLPDLAPLTVAQILDRALRDHQRRSGQRCLISRRTLPEQMPLATKIALYRIVQDVLEHRSSQENAAHELTIASDGTALSVVLGNLGPVAGGIAAAGLGPLDLQVLRDRAESVGGAVRIAPVPGGGRRMVVTLRLAQGASPEGGPASPC